MAIAIPARESVQDFTNRTHRLLIDGDWVEPADGRTASDARMIQTPRIGAWPEWASPR